MRTTLDIPDDVLVQIRAISRERGQSLGHTVAEIIRAGFAKPTAPSAIEIAPDTGLPLVYLGRPTTSDDVRALDDDE